MKTRYGNGIEMVWKWYQNGINVWYASIMLNTWSLLNQNYGNGMETWYGNGMRLYGNGMDIVWKWHGNGINVYGNCMEMVWILYGNDMEMASMFGMLQ